MQAELIHWPNAPRPTGSAALPWRPTAEKEARAAELCRRARRARVQSDLAEKTNAPSQQVSEKKAAQAALAAERDAGSAASPTWKRLRPDMVIDWDQRRRR